MSKFSISAPRYKQGAVGCWQEFFYLAILEYSQSSESVRSISVKEFMEHKLNQYSARWDVKNSQVTFATRDDLVRFKLTYG